MNLQFTDITMSSLNVSWDPPKKRNGDILGYLVTYETTEQNERELILYFIIILWPFQLLRYNFIKLLININYCR